MRVTYTALVPSKHSADSHYHYPTVCKVYTNHSFIKTLLVHLFLYFFIFVYVCVCIMSYLTFKQVQKKQEEY